MKQAFVRGLWGNFSGPEEAAIPRPKKMEDDILAQSPDNPKAPHHDFVVYTMGIHNHQYLIDHGFNSVLMDERPSIWDMKTELYRHKLELLKRAMEDYDEIVYLDWDCYQVKPFPNDFWDILRQGDVCQTNLYQYRTKKCLWRDGDWRKTCNGGFIYLSDKSLPDKFIKNWDELRIWVLEQQQKRRARGLELRFREKSLIFDDEPAISKFIDNHCGGWPGLEEYWNRFETKVCNLRKKSAFTKEQNATKNACFMHFI